MSTKIDQLEIEVTSESKEAVKGLQQLISTLEKVDKVSQGKGLDVLHKKLEKISRLNFSNLDSLKGLNAINKNFDAVAKKAKSMTPTFDQVGKQVESISEKVASNATVPIKRTIEDVKELNDIMTGKSFELKTDGSKNTSNIADNLIKSTSQTELLNLKLNGVKDKLNNITSADDIDKSKIANLVGQAQKLTNQLNGLNKPLHLVDNTNAVDDLIKNSSQVDILRMKMDDVKGKLSTALSSDTIDQGKIANYVTQYQRLNNTMENLTPKAVKAETAIHRLQRQFRMFGNSAIQSTKKAVNGISQVLKIVLIYGGAFRAVMILTQGMTEGLQNIAFYSKETANNMNQLSTDALYLKNSIGAALYPVIVQLLPVINQMTDAIVRTLNIFNQFVSAMSGSKTYIRAKKYLKEYGEQAKKTAKDIKKSFAGMDEITVIGNESASDANSKIPDYSQMFEEVKISDKMTKITDIIKSNLDNIKIILGSSLLAVGAILTFTGANIPLGIGLMVAGAVTLAKTVPVAWDSMDKPIKNAVDRLMIILGSSLLVIGAILTFSNVNIPLGIGMMASGALLIAKTVATNWDGMPDKVKVIIDIIEGIVGAAFLTVGIILALTNPTLMPLGIGLLAIGAVAMAHSIAVNWDSMTDQVKDIIQTITAILSIAFLVIGACFTFTGANIPLGIGLMVVGAAAMAGACAINWEWMKEKIKVVVSSILAIVAGASAVIGIILCLSGVGIPFGIPMLIAAVAESKGAAKLDDNPITRAVKKMMNGLLDLVESGVNGIIRMLNKISFDIPDWFPGFGGKHFGFDIKYANIPRLKDGGFPDGEDGLFFANHGEMVGQFSNGRTAVANNAQIVEGIERGVYSANQEQNELLKEQNRLLKMLIETSGRSELNINTIAKAQTKQNRKAGKTVIPVGV